MESLSKGLIVKNLQKIKRCFKIEDFCYFQAISCRKEWCINYKQHLWALFAICGLLIKNYNQYKILCKEELHMYEVDYKAMGKRIREKRIELGLTQEKLAEKVGVGESHIGGIERGENICSLLVAAAISEVLEINMDRLVKGVNSGNVNQAFSEILGEVPDNNKDLYVKICEGVAEKLK